MRRLLLPLLAVLAAFLVAVPLAGAKSPPFVGMWKGTVKDDAGATQTVVVTVTAKLKSNNSGTISYTQGRCTGRLAFLQQSGRVLTLRETITKGACLKGGSVKLSQIDYRTLWFEWWGTATTSARLTGYVTLGGR